MIGHDNDYLRLWARPQFQKRPWAQPGWTHLCRL